MQAIIELIKKHKLTQYESLIINEVKKSIRLTREMKDEKEIGIGASKMGGYPDLPEGFDIPNYDGKSLHFLMQINMNDIPNEIELKSLLPKTGLLSFFSDEDAYYFDESDKPLINKAWKVFYFEDTKNLARTVYEIPNSNDEFPFNSASIFFREELTLSFEYDYLGLDIEEEDVEKYYNMVEEFYEDEYKPFNEIEERFHQMFGNPLTIQGDIFNDFDNSDEWLLLLQVDSDGHYEKQKQGDNYIKTGVGFCWGDLGRLYYMIKKDDLVNLDFTNVVLTMQCS